MKGREGERESVRQREREMRWEESRGKGYERENDKHFITFDNF